MSKRYKLSSDTLTALKPFETYLHGEQFGSNYIRQNLNYAGTFLEWLNEQSFTPAQVTHADMMEFADKIRESGYSIRLVNQTMLAVRYYYAWLQQDGQATHNPAAGIILKGTVRNIPHDLLTKTELETLYQNYEAKDNRTHRNKVMIGLLVYQALTKDELERLRPEHLKLREGKINVPAVGRQMSRILPLQPHQILELHEYQLVVRPAILAERMNERAGRKPGHYKDAQEISRLFISINSVESLKNSLLHLNYALRKLEPKYKHLKQIRQSVITEWLKEKNIRTVQYMAGHRYVSSTERYKTTNLEDLKEALNKYHPLSI